MLPGGTLCGDSPSRIQLGPQRIFVFHAAKTPWSGVLPERCNYQHRLRGPVGRAPVLGTIQSELAIVAKRLVSPVCKLQHGLRPRIHAASQHERHVDDTLTPDRTTNLEI